MMSTAKKRSVFFVGFIFLLLLGVSTTLWQHARKSTHALADDRFESESNHLYQQIRERFNAHRQVLRGGVGLFYGSENVSREEWRVYVEKLALAEDFPGIQGVGFSQWIGDADALIAHERALRLEGFTEYEVRPVNTRQHYSAITYLEPFDERNRQAFGFDMYSERIRRQAMDRARDTGQPALSGKVELVQEITDDKQAGFLLYLPVYKKGAAIDTKEARKIALLGFIYSPFRANDLMDGILQQDISNIAFKIYDQNSSSEDAILYDGHVAIGLNLPGQKPSHELSKQVMIAGRQWAIEFSSTPEFESTYDSAYPTAVICIGLLLSLLISAIAWMLLSTRIRVMERTSELKETELANSRLIEATRIAQSANMAKSAFLAAMSHEIRTPMNGVVGMVEVLLNESPNSQQKHSLNVVLESALSLLTIIDDVLDFSKIESGNLELEKTVEPLDAIVESVVKSIIPQAINSNVIVSLFIDPNVPDIVLVDAVRLRQILTNLTGNAVKFSGSRSDCVGRVDLRVSRSTINSSDLVFRVIDNGIGIENSAIESIFHSFVQAESSTTRRFGGSGLGLAICKRLVEIMDGQIGVSSVPGEGSVFTVTLPLTAENVPEKERFEEVAGVKCYVIRSPDYNADDLRTYLESVSAEVQIKSNIRELYSSLQGSQGPTVIVSAESHEEELDIPETAIRAFDVRRVLLSRGFGRHIVDGDIRPGGADDVSKKTISAIRIQLDGLLRHEFIEAVSIAAGKASPEILYALTEMPVVEAVHTLSVTDALANGTLILVAEDDVINQKVLNKQLSMHGYTAEFARDGLEALELWRSKRYGMVFTDLHMPRMDGYELTKAIREEEVDSERIPIVALTANAMRGEVNRAREAGVDEYLTKPIRLHLLKRAVEEHLQSIDKRSQGTPTYASEQAKVGDCSDHVFDQDVLVDLLGHDTQTIVDCIQQFLQSLDENGDRLIAAVQNNDKKTARHLAHQLTSSSNSVGTLELGAECLALQRACDERGRELSVEDVKSIDVSLKRARDVLAVALRNN